MPVEVGDKKRNIGKSVKWFKWKSVTKTWDESQEDLIQSGMDD